MTPTMTRTNEHQTSADERGIFFAGGAMWSVNACFDKLIYIGG
jgi:hypothetical protein